VKIDDGVQVFGGGVVNRWLEDFAYVVRAGHHGHLLPGRGCGADWVGQARIIGLSAIEVGSRVDRHANQVSIETGRGNGVNALGDPSGAVGLQVERADINQRISA
jgi:hypothetical protein